MARGRELVVPPLTCVACQNGSVPEWLKCARRPEMARAPIKLSARNIRTIIIHKTYVLLYYYTSFI